MCKGRIGIVCLTAVLFALSACDKNPQRVVLRGATMGTTWSVIYAEPASSPTVSPRELQALIESELLAINQALSTYIPDSEISLINAAMSGGDEKGEAGGVVGVGGERTATVVVSPMFAKVLEEALAVGSLTGGAYDVTVGPLIELWGFGAQAKTPTPPTDAQIELARANVGAQRLSWDSQQSLLGIPAGVRIDLSSIAKGYAVDLISTLVQGQGIYNSLVEIG